MCAPICKKAEHEQLGDLLEASRFLGVPDILPARTNEWWRVVPSVTVQFGLVGDRNEGWERLKQFDEPLSTVCKHVEIHALDAMPSNGERRMFGCWGTTEGVGLS